jgi:hypothetical protein
MHPKILLQMHKGKKKKIETAVKVPKTFIPTTLLVAKAKQS